MSQRKRTKKPIEYLKTEGIVIRYVNFNDSDRIISIITPKYGKMSIMVKNGRSNKNKNLPSLQMFAYSQFALTKRGEFYYIKETELIKSFFDIINNVEKYTLATYFSEIVYKSANENELQLEIFVFHLKSLYTLLLSRYSLINMYLYFDIHVMKLLGYQMQLFMCHQCGTPLNKYYFDYYNGFFVCNVCANKEISDYTEEVDLGTIKTVQKLSESDFEVLGIIRINERMQKKILKINNVYMNNHLDKVIKSRELTNQFLFVE